MLLTVSALVVHTDLNLRSESTEHCENKHIWPAAACCSTAKTSSPGSGSSSYYILDAWSGRSWCFFQVFVVSLLQNTVNHRLCGAVCNHSQLRFIQFRAEKGQRDAELLVWNQLLCSHPVVAEICVVSQTQGEIIEGVLWDKCSWVGRAWDSSTAASDAVKKPTPSLTFMI